MRPNARASGRGDEVARHQIPLRADQPWPDDGAAVAGDNTDRDVRITDLRVGGCDAHVADQRDRRAETDNGPFDRGDDGLRHVEHVEDDSPTFVEDDVSVGGGHVAQPSQVVIAAAVETNFAQWKDIPPRRHHGTGDPLPDYYPYQRQLDAVHAGAAVNVVTEM
jgi:hypothetical protein